VYTTSYAEAMFAFMTPAIRTVHVFIDMAFCSLLAKMPTMAGIASRCRATTFGLHMTFNPSLLRGQYPMPTVTEALSVLVCSLQPLACVTIPAFLAGSTLLHLAACVDLRELNIIGRAAAINNTVPVELPPRSFPVLDTVCIEESGTTARLSKAVFQRPPTEHLQHVKVKSRVLPLREWIHLCTWMGAHTSLKSVSLEMSLPPEDGLVDLPIHLLQPLTALSRLEVLDVRSSRPLPIDEDDLLDATSHWPSLRSFRVQMNASAARAAPSCGISLMAFCVVLGMCPQLTELPFVVVACAVEPAIGDLAAFGSGAHPYASPLRVTDVGDVDELACILRRVVPRVKMVKRDTNGDFKVDQLARVLDSGLSVAETILQQHGQGRRAKPKGPRSTQEPTRLSNGTLGI
jgi:hypothetical protein